MTVFGIDPGAEHTGWAVIEELRGGWSVSDAGTLRDKSWQDAVRRLGPIAEPWLHDPCLAAVNVPAVAGQAAPFFAKSGKRSPMSIVKNGVLSGAMCGAMCAWGWDVVQVVSKPGRGMKMDAKLWAAYWGYDGRCSEHARDAAQIALTGYRMWSGMR